MSVSDGRRLPDARGQDGAHRPERAPRELLLRQALGPLARAQWFWVCLPSGGIETGLSRSARPLPASASVLLHAPTTLAPLPSRISEIAKLNGPAAQGK